ncbi:MAG: CatA-like O-acetyltransferase, partial [Victivallaceae bacterium]
MSPYTIIAQSTWPRAMHCQVFKRQLNPTYTVGFELDITDFKPWVKSHNYSFTLAMMHIVSRCANQLENFRYRFLNGDVVLYDKCPVNFVWLNPETELFKFVNYPFLENMTEFISGARNAAEAQTAYFIAPPANDAFIFSPLPWVSYTEKTHTFSGNSEQASPIFDWGKFFTRNQ